MAEKQENEKKLTFEFEKETKNTFRFKEQGNEQVIGTLYVQKTFFKKKPKRIEVILKVAE